MSDIRLVNPCEEYLSSYLDACWEFHHHDVTPMFLHDPDLYEQWRHTLVERLEKDRLGIDLPEGYVPASTFWLVEDGTFVGMGNIRHRLTPSLEIYGGHIGYAIRPSRWGQGVGTLQLRLLLREARKLGIEHALVTCDESNIGSARVMEKNGGVWQDTIEHQLDGRPHRTKRYWIDTNV